MLDIFKELKDQGLSKSFETFIPHFIIHQLKFMDPIYVTEAENFDINFTNEMIIESLYLPFKSKHLKIDYSYLIKKLIDYSFLFNEEQSTEFCVSMLSDENVRKDFINWCFFSSIEKLVHIVGELHTATKWDFYKMVMKMMPMMSDKQ